MSCEKQTVWEWFKSFLPVQKRDLAKLSEQLNNIMATQQEVVADLKIVREQQKKTLGEIKGIQDKTDTLNAKILELEALIAAGGTIGQELVDVTAELKAGGLELDDSIPDPIAPPV